MSHFLLVWMLCLILSGCLTTSVDSREVSKWESVTVEQFRRTVEDSGSRDVWNYAGSDNIHHYFYREPGRMFIGSYLYYKVPKADVQGIPRGREVPFDGKAVSLAFAFTQMAKDRSGFTHSLPRGLVDNVLIPSP